MFYSIVPLSKLCNLPICLQCMHTQLETGMTVYNKHITNTNTTIDNYPPNTVPLGKCLFLTTVWRNRFADPSHQKLNHLPISKVTEFTRKQLTKTGIYKT